MKGEFDMKMKKLMGAVLLTCGISAASGVYAQGVPVFDATAAANFIQQLMNQQEELGLSQDQLSMLQNLVDSSTGNRGLGSVNFDPALREYLPLEWQGVYDDVMSNPQASGILEGEVLEGTIDQQQAHVVDRRRQAIAADKSIGMRGLEMARVRMNTIDALMQQIDSTQDQKAIEELQARIAIEQAGLQNDIIRLQLVQQLQVAETRLMDEQRRQVGQEVFNPANTGMPRIR